jgi:hypothetical protein
LGGGAKEILLSEAEYLELPRPGQVLPRGQRPGRERVSVVVGGSVRLRDCGRRAWKAAEPNQGRVRGLLGCWNAGWQIGPTRKLRLKQIAPSTPRWPPGAQAWAGGQGVCRTRYVCTLDRHRRLSRDPPESRAGVRSALVA